MKTITLITVIFISFISNQAAELETIFQIFHSTQFLSIECYPSSDIGKDDLLSKVLKKYESEYEFIHTGDFRNAPQPLHPSMSWPDKGIELQYLAYIKIKDQGHGREYYNEIIRKILTDLEIKESRIEKAVSEFALNDEYQHIDYYTRVIEIKKLRTYINMKFYLIEE
ncbi:MAG: hypothetical protein K9H48_18545 [Melioribacteraceae bacterium]|nr:hypothetical protein [Melioribacteraceae bacterium]MCF8395825.1 hypothetical protein [Melioribacteraceae bacterium]MCF8420919.1 hypothetical protein [Melioribacteraceae bacterium]